MHQGTRVGLLILALSWTFSAVAEVHFQDTRLWRRAQLAPVGQQIWGFQSSYQNTSNQSSGQSYSKRVTWAQLLDQAIGQDRADLEGFMRSVGARDSDVAATAEYEVRREDIGFRATWAYGLLPTWTLGFDIPVVYRKTSVNTKVTTPSAIRTFQVRSVDQSVKEISERELAASGYDLMPEEAAEWLWGDVTLLSQFSVMRGYGWMWSLQQLVRFPTARNPDLDDYIQASDDSGQVDLGVTSLVDFRLKRWLMGARGGFVAQLPDVMKARVSPKDEARAVDPDVKRDLGDWVWGGAMVEYRVTRRFYFEVEHSYLYKFRDKYTGGSKGTYNYSDLARNTEQNLQQTQVGVNYELSSEGRRGGIENKWLASLAVSYPWTAQNVSRAERATLDLVTYF